MCDERKVVKRQLEVYHCTETSKQKYFNLKKNSLQQFTNL